jgi:hypothetical protein
MMSMEREFSVHGKFGKPEDPFLATSLFPVQELLIPKRAQFVFREGIHGLPVNFINMNVYAAHQI